MAPTRTKKTATPDETIPSEDMPQQRIVTMQSPARKPLQSPVKKPLMITESQKQALIDNLQLEVTERARKLRAQYALQAQSLRTRIELRINRIPTSLRKANMGELYQKYHEAAKDPAVEPTASGAATPKPPKATVEPEKPQPPLKPDQNKAAPRPRGLKRTSDHFDHADKENTPGPGQIPNPKKRTKTTVTGTSRQVTNPSTVLSPKSSNSRTLPHSPIRPALCSPQKSHLSRPASPLKPMSPSKQLSPSKHLSPSKQLSPAKSAAIAATAILANMVAEKPKATRAKAGAGRKATNPTAAASKPPATRARRGAGATRAVAEMRTASSSSDVSTTSNATTVMRKAGRPPAAAKTTAQKRGVGVSAAGKKVADAPPAGRRVLRKRA